MNIAADELTVHQNLCTKTVASPFTQMIKQYTEKQPVSVELLEAANAFLEGIRDPIEGWQHFISVLLIYSEEHPAEPLPAKLSYLFNHLIELNDEEGLLTSSYYYLGHQLLTGKLPEDAELQQMGCGAIPHEHPLLGKMTRLPTPARHAEHGVILALIGALSHDFRWLQGAKQAAFWQLHILDYNHLPHSSLYMQEKQTDEEALIEWNTLLFESVGLVMHSSELYEVAKKQRSFLPRKLPPFLSLIHTWLMRRYPLPQETAPPPSLEICDCDIPLAGVRNHEYSVLATLAGHHTGMGLVACKKTAIVNYGPHILPFIHSHHFGIQAPLDFYANHNKSFIEFSKEQFTIERPVRFAHQHWTDVKIQWHNKTLDINLHLLNPPLTVDQTFIFYVQSPICTLETGEIIPYRSLDRYSGPIEKINFANEMTLDAVGAIAHMEIIPLAGDKEFWGADYLISYILDPKKAVCQWEISIL